MEVMSVVDNVVLGGVIIVPLLIGLAGAALALVIAPSLFAPGGAGAQDDQKRSGNIRSASAAQDWVYGTVRKGGVIFYVNGTGDDNKYLHEMIALAGHEVDAIEEVYFNAVALNITSSGVDANGVSQDVPSGTEFDGLARIKNHLGSLGQAADADAVAENGNWTAAHTANNIAYLYTRLEYDQNVWTSFIPTITARVRGLNDLYDPRTGGRGFSNNPALIVADMIMRFINVPLERIDADSFLRAANCCDELVEKKDGTFEKRYQADFFFELKEGDELEKHMAPALRAMAGHCVEHNGIYYISAGKWDEVCLEIDDSHILGQINLRTAESDKNRANIAKGTFVGEESYDTENEFPIIKNATYIAQDGGVELAMDLDLEAVASPCQAQRVANIYLEEQRHDETVEFESNLCIGLDIKPNDVVKVNSKVLQMSDYYRVIINRQKFQGGRDARTYCPLKLKRTDPSIYEWDAATQEQDYTATESDLPSAPSDKPRVVRYSIDLFSTAPDGHPADVVMTWLDPLDPVAGLEVEVLLNYEYRTLTPLGVWTAGTITVSSAVGTGAGVITVAMIEAALGAPAGGYEFRGQEVVYARMRADRGDGSFSGWCLALVS